jgi:hypothetical protein
MSTQNIVVEHRGCGSGCVSVFLVVGALAIAYQYWYVTVPLLLVVGGGAWFYYFRFATHPCPRCAGRVRNGHTACTHCGYDAAPSAVQWR